MNTKQLRQKILDLAICGKLVPQDPNDEPASMLLERIQEEKKRLVREKIIKQAKNTAYSMKKDYYSQHQKLPIGWELCSLGDVCLDFQYGTSQKSDKSGEIAVLRMGNLQNGEVDYTDLAFSSDEGDIEKYLLNEGELLFNRTNSPEWVGKTSIYRGDIPAIFAGYIIRVAPIFIDPHYLNYAMNSDYHRAMCQQAKTDGVNQSNINAQKLSRFVYPLPPLAEQHRIVAAIISTFAIIDEIERNKADLQAAVTAAKQKILSLAVQGKLVPQDPNDEPAEAILTRIATKKERLLKDGKMRKGKKTNNSINEEDTKNHFIPSGWALARLEGICQLITDGTHQTPKYADDGFIFLSSKNVKSGKIDWDNVMYTPQELHDVLYARLAPEIGDVLLAKNGTTGFAAVVDRDCIFDIYVSLALIRTFKEEISPQFLRHIISSEVVQSHFRGNLKGIGVPNLHLEHIRSAIIPVCSLAEQHRIVEAVELAFEQLDIISKSLS